MKTAEVKPKNGVQKLAKLEVEKHFPENPEMRFGTRNLKVLQYRAQINLSGPYSGEEFQLTEYEEMIALNIAYGKPWTMEEKDALSPAERHLLYCVIGKACNCFAKHDRDLLYEKIDGILSPDNKKDHWEQNHYRILNALQVLTDKLNRFPSRLEISNLTGLSRTTIDKHLQEYFGSDAYKQKKDEYVVMRESLMAKIYSMANKGDLKAARIFLEATAQVLQPPQIRNTQNNYIHINIDQVKNLPPERQQQLNEILLMVTKPDLQTEAVNN